VIRVLLDCRMADWSGVGRYTKGLVRALAARDDVELVQVCAPGVLAPVQPRPGCKVMTAAAGPPRGGGGRAGRRRPDAARARDLRPHRPGAA
jgi:hypothetical protein